MFRYLHVNILAELEDQNRPPAAPFRRRPEEKSLTVPLGPDCPRCGHTRQDAQPVAQWIKDLPPVRPHVTHLTT